MMRAEERRKCKKRSSVTTQPHRSIGKERERGRGRKREVEKERGRR